MSYLTKNHATPDKLTIGGEIAIVDDGKITKDGVAVNLGGSAQLADGSVTAAKLANGAVTVAKLDSSLTSTLNGKLTATKAAAVPDTAATDAAGVLAELRDLKTKLRAAGILA
ncbi:hypothetical protein [Paenibacillus peoriae]|uniref:hypothetical protein n=1 Tax=Paenibacillus peoriae TaxID=59893 RepID=UPI0006A6F5D6|nr:hypothetical protein [Paenibacillus peoriae]